MTDDITYEPTREHWTPYEPWMLDVLAADARVSWIDAESDSDPMECRAAWNSLDPVELARLNSLTPTGFMRWFGTLRIHPDDVPERRAEADPDEALAKVLYETYLRDTADEWDDEHPAVQEAWLRSARTAREHIANGGDSGGRSR